MQTHNLVIIPIPQTLQIPFSIDDSILSSPTKTFNKSLSQKDDISWKKSASAFKKFKGKKDKQTKSNKNSQTSIPFLEQQPEDQIVNKNFTLVDYDINFSLLNNLNYQPIKQQQTFHYYDPNFAPFFQYNHDSQYLTKQPKPQTSQQIIQPIKLTKRPSIKIKRQISKKQKIIKQQIPQIDNIIKQEKSITPQQPIPIQTQKVKDHFVIVKSCKKQDDQEFQQNDQNFQKDGLTKKVKIIKKGKIYSSRAPSIYSHDSNYIHKSADLIKSESQSSDSEQNNYGDDQLPIIQFDLCGRFNSSNCEEQKQYNGLDNLPIYQTKDTSQVLARLKPYQNTTQILQEYEFNQEFVDKENNQKRKKESQKKKSRDSQDI